MNFDQEYSLSAVLSVVEPWTETHMDDMNISGRSLQPSIFSRWLIFPISVALLGCFWLAQLCDVLEYAGVWTINATVYLSILFLSLALFAYSANRFT